MEGGKALAEVLFGDVNPSGKLPETFYRRHTDCSAHAVGEFPGDTKVRYKEGIFVGYRYNDTFHIDPEFCFGHGLSYTTFEYSNPSVKFEQDRVKVCCDVENTGTVSGKETVQIYLVAKERKEDEPVQQLKGFEKTELKPGEKKRVEILVEVSCMILEHTEATVTGTLDDEKDSERMLLQNLQIRIGSSSRDIRLTIE